MTIKKLFGLSEIDRNYLSDQTQKTVVSDIESSENLKQIRLKQQTFVPQVNYYEPAEFAKFGSAYLYYKSAIGRILNFYPYDGSDAELNKFYNNSLDIEKYIFNELYPRSTGYVILSADEWGTATSVTSDGYGIPTTTEYITFFGGPNIATAGSELKSIVPDPLSSKFQYNNIYDTNMYANAGLPTDYGIGTRESNLKSSFDTGVTVEFWAKTGSLSTSLTQKQVLFDMWNNEASSSADYGRVTIELDGTATGSPFLITAQSGTLSASCQTIFTSSIGDSVTLATLNDWKHYALAFYNSGSDFIVKFYVDGVLDDTNTYASVNLNELKSKNMVGRIGGLLTAPSGTVDTTLTTTYVGGGKLSGSLDEFRFWKSTRDAAQINKSWFTQIRGGVNTDISNTALGMYYKFNEGVTGTSAVDSVVLDYGGRLCNGSWTGYGTNSRNTGSAILSASAAIKEYEDPIIYADHASVASLKNDLLGRGQWYDGQNAALFRNLMPAWMIESSDGTDNTDLDRLSHILGAYFDKLYLQISAVPSLRYVNYTSASYSPISFAQHLPQSLGLYTPDLFIDSTILEAYANRDKTQLFEGDLTETKNLIYKNLYNNLAHIYKSKGTERAIRNVFRCFNLDDRLVSYNVYSNNQTYDLKTNLKQTLKTKTFVNFNDIQHLDAVVYQASNPSESDSVGFISGTYALGREDNYGLTLEAGITFPRFFRSLDSFSRNFLTSSLFGMQTVNSSSADDPAFLSGAQDVANFQVYSVRDKKYSSNVYFKLTSSVDPHPFSALTSSTFLNVYDDENWNLSVRVKPSNYPLANIVSGATDYTYDVVFSGFNNKLGVIQDSFEVSASVTKAVGQNLLRASKRVYAGARNTNITGTNVYKSDVLLSNVKYWTKYIDNVSLEQHTYDRENAGISGSYRNISPLDSVSDDAYNFNTLALDWGFEKITGSDGSGNFYTSDLSSGSAQIRAAFDWVSQIGAYLHTGKGVGFFPNYTGSVNKKYVNEFIFDDPERVVSSDMVQALSEVDDTLVGHVEQVPNYVYVIEKSLYAAISKEILDFFAGAVDFHDLIGQPVNRYRERYKMMESLRRIFFEKFQDIQTVERFTEYYKWFDDAIAIIISQLVPGSADFIDDVYNTVEGHVLERNKYPTKYPTIEFRTPDPEGKIRGIEEKIVDYVDMSSPLPSSPRPTTQHKMYWQQRAEASSPEISSPFTYVDNQRQIIKEVSFSTPDMSQSMPWLRTVDGTDYQRNRLLATQLDPTVLFDTNRQKEIHGGVNFAPTKKIGYTYTALYPAGPVYNPSGGIYIPQNVLLGLTEELVALQELEMTDWRRLVRVNASTPYWQTDYESNHPNRKLKRVIKVQHGRDHEEGIGYSNVKSTLAFPFNIMSSSVVSGYNKFVVERVTASIEVTNLHNDVYGDDMEVPMQGHWPQYAAGGHQSRHVPLNKSSSTNTNIWADDSARSGVGLDNYTSRPEAWKLLLGTCANTTGAIGMVGADYPWPEANEFGQRPYPLTASQKAVYYRDFVAKTPYVFKNILLRTGSTVLGNYRHNYDIVNTVGAHATPRQFIKNQPVFAPSQDSSLRGEGFSSSAGTFQGAATKATQTKTIFDIHRFAGWLPGCTSEYTGYTGSHIEFVPDISVAYLTQSVNKSVIRSRFSNPGGLEVSPAGYRDFRSDEYSVYNATNYRNLTVIKPSQGPSGSLSEPTGAGGPGIRVSDLHGYDFGLRALTARHATRFFRDSLWVSGTTSVFSATDPRSGAPGAQYAQLPCFHRVHRNNKPFYKNCTTTLVPNYLHYGLINSASLYWGQESESDRMLINAESSSAATLLTSSRAYGLTYSTWISFPPYTNAGEHGHSEIFSVGKSAAGNDPFIRVWRESGSYDTVGGYSTWNLGLDIRTRKIHPWTGTAVKATLSASANLLNDGNWHHIAVTLPTGAVSTEVGTTIGFYIDGSPVTAVTGTAIPDPAWFDQAKAGAYDVAGWIERDGASVWTIGNSSTTWGSADFTGSMDQIAIWTRAISAADVVEIYNDGIPCDITASAAYTYDSDRFLAWYLLGEVPEDPAQADAIKNANPGNFVSGANSIFNNNNSGSEHNLFPLGKEGTQLNTLEISETQHPTPLEGCTADLLGYNEVTTTCLTNVYDNLSVRHQIPRSDRQYAFFTGALSASNDLRYYCFMPVVGSMTGMYSSSMVPRDPSGDMAIAVGGIESYFAWVTSSNFGSIHHMGATARTWGVADSGSNFLPTPFTNLNWNIYEPLSAYDYQASASANTLGWPTGTVIYSPTDTTPQYRNVTLVPATDEDPAGHTLLEATGAIFNAIMLKRNSIYGWSPFAQTHQQDHPILIDEKRNNKLSLIYLNHGPTRFELRPVSLKGRAVACNIDYITPITIRGITSRIPHNAVFKTTYNNEFIYYNQARLDDYLDIDVALLGEITPFEQLVGLKGEPGFALNWIDYTECVYPALVNEFAATSSFRVGFDNKFWRTNQQDRVYLGQELSNSLGIWSAISIPTSGHRLSQSSWPLDAPTNFLTRSGPPILTKKTSATQFQVDSLRQSSSAGELQNTYGWYHPSSSATKMSTLNLVPNLLACVSPGGLYARKQTLASPLSVTSPGTVAQSCSIGSYIGGFEFNPVTDVRLGASRGAGEAFWDAPATAGYLKAGPDPNDPSAPEILSFVSAASEPWFNDYDDFKADLKLKARGYSIIPEFRISEKMEAYMNEGIASDFNTFQIPGTDRNSTEDGFYLDYSNSDFMKKFLDIKQMSGLSAKEIKITCHAAIRFNPYKGFYPAQRTLDLIKQFSSSYHDAILIDNNVDTTAYPVPLSGAGAGSARLIYQPLFAPGILYNSIKSGIACDWPVPGVGNQFTASLYTGSNSDPAAGGEYNYAWYPSYFSNPSVANFVTGNVWSKRIPFEAIIDPHTSLAGLELYDMEPDPSASIAGGQAPITASVVSAPADQLYSYMASNFAAEVGNFFLKNSTFSRLASSGVTLDPKRFEGAGEVYGARLRLKNSYNGQRAYTYESGASGDNSMYTKFGALALFTDTGFGADGSGFEIPQDPRFNPDFKRNFVMYSRPTAFGPPISGRLPPGQSSETNIYVSSSEYGAVDCFNGFNWAYTPPHWHGEAWVDFIFRPQAETDYTLESILAETTAIYSRYDHGPRTGSETSASGDYSYSLINDNMGYPDGNRSPYNGYNINHNAMQMSASVNLFGVENIFKKRVVDGHVVFEESEIVGKRWIIQPKFETPMLNFSDDGIRPVSPSDGTKTLPTYHGAAGNISYGGDTAANGMWHQFGVIPEDPAKGVWLEMGDIPSNWLQYHYSVVSESSAYNNFTPPPTPAGSTIHTDMKSFSNLMGFGMSNSRTKLGMLADRQTIKEAIVVVPYIIEGAYAGEFVPAAMSGPFGMTVTAPVVRKSFINIPTARYEAALDESMYTESGMSLDAAGESIRRLVQKMGDYVLPPQFDFLQNPGVDPIVMYILEFKYDLDTDDLSYIWQNLAPRNYQKMSMQKYSVAHELLNTELLEERNIMENPNLRWMVFKVKQKSQLRYLDVITPQVMYPTPPSILFGLGELHPGGGEDYPLRYNWPYDFVSIIELAKIDVEVMYRPLFSAVTPGTAPISTGAGPGGPAAALGIPVIAGTTYSGLGDPGTSVVSESDLPSWRSAEFDRVVRSEVPVWTGPTQDTAAGYGAPGSAPLEAGHVREMPQTYTAEYDPGVPNLEAGHWVGGPRIAPYSTSTTIIAAAPVEVQQKVRQRSMREAIKKALGLGGSKPRKP